MPNHYQVTPDGLYAVQIASMEHPVLPNSKSMGKMAEYYSEMDKYREHLASLHPNPILLDKPQEPGKVLVEGVDVELRLEIFGFNQKWIPATKEFYNHSTKRRIILTTIEGREQGEEIEGHVDNEWTRKLTKHFEAFPSKYLPEQLAQSTYWYLKRHSFNLSTPSQSIEDAFVGLMDLIESVAEDIHDAHEADINNKALESARNGISEIKVRYSLFLQHNKTTV